MQLKMRNGNVAIELLTPQDKTMGGIFIPTTVRQGNLRFGKVVEVGPGELVQGQMVEMDLKKGDEVIFDISHTEPVLIDADQLFICNMVDVIAVVSAKHLSVIPGAKQA
jgi:chaperonin GroES